MKEPITHVANLKHLIASRIAGEVKAYDIEEFCTRHDLREAGGENPWDSKYKYAENRIRDLPLDKSLELAEAIHAELGGFALLEEIRKAKRGWVKQISEVTRQSIRQELCTWNSLGGDREDISCIESTWPLNEIPAFDTRFADLLSDFVQHTVRNYDYETGDLLDRLGIDDCSDDQLLEFLCAMVHPLSRKGAVQQETVDRLNKLIEPDGFTLLDEEEMSGHRIYTWAALREGVAGTPKNIIFASTGPKPEIVLSDAINNDVEIVRNADCVLVYDRPVSDKGLLWKDLVQWWISRDAEEASENPARSLYLRLLKSVELSRSEPEKRFFSCYYHEFKKLGEQLPALLPQVYLHFDPLIKRLVRDRQPLVFQRMDFLLILPSRNRVVVELDGKQHYSDNEQPSPGMYASMMKEDRSLKLRGYDVYRFGGAEFVDEATSQHTISGFFTELFRRYGISGVA